MGPAGRASHNFIQLGPSTELRLTFGLQTDQVHMQVRHTRADAPAWIILPFCRFAWPCLALHHLDMAQHAGLSCCSKVTGTTPNLQAGEGLSSQLRSWARGPVRAGA